MQTPDLSCPENLETEDKVSEIGENLVKNGSSRKWTSKDSSNKSSNEDQCSEMKESYIYCKSEVAKDKGKRKAMLLKQFYDEAKKEIIKENTPVSEKPKYDTEYDNEFKIPGFKPNNKFFISDPELYQKYPLYSSEPVSLYSFQFENHPDTSLPGLTTPPNKINLFRKNAKFSKPIDDSLDEKYVEI